MIKYIKYTTIVLLLIGCSEPKDKIRNIILYDNGNTGYWNLEWPRERAEYYGFTFKLDKNGKVAKYSFDKVENKRSLFYDPELIDRMEWGVANDSIFTLMNYNSQIKITKYNNDTIWLYDKTENEKSILIKVKYSL